MKKLTALVCCIACSLVMYAQVGINSDGTQPDPSAMLEIKSTSKGILPPRVTTAQRDAIVSPATGLVIFNTNCSDLQFFNGAVWVPIGNIMWSVAGAVSGNMTPCANSSGETYTTLPNGPGLFYHWQVPTGSTITSGQGTAAITVAFGTISGSIAVSEFGICGKGLGQSININLIMAPATPVAGVHVSSATQITWKWGSSSGATGYKFNTINNFATAMDLGTATSTTETGLTCLTSYMRYVWAYNACGNSTPAILTQTTSACSSSCGSSLTINHVAGMVAPVTKTVTYGTVSNIPGETSKCWITRNLGASQQATAVDDATESSAGWYWQFNRKQGFRHDGTTRTPATTWINSNAEASDWIPANDPCTLELGSGWRIPVYSEWYNVDNIGNWTNWNGPWDSGLKMHAAGYLPAGDGSLSSRGSYGFYWSSTQIPNTYGWYLQFSAGHSNMIDGNKANGFTARCVRDY
jgi:hypothetical protein